VRYFQLILQSERTPQLTPQMRSIIDALVKPVAADYAPTAELALPGVDRFQAPHHGGAVIRALLHRGALIGTTEDGMLGIWNNAPPRSWSPLRNPPYPMNRKPNRE
jgi:hypothetical protein